MSTHFLKASIMFFYNCLIKIVLFLSPKRLLKKSIKGELVLITGGAGGLGQILAICFAKLGAHTILWDLNKSGLEETVRMVKEANPHVTCKAYFCDITDKEMVYEIANRIKREIGSVSILVTNAGVVNGKNFIDIPDHKIVQTFNVNVMSHFWILKAFLPDMMAKNKGHLVLIASAQLGGCKMTDFFALKFGYLELAKTLRLELLQANSRGVKSTIVFPYFTQTGMFAFFKSPIIPALEPIEMANKIINGILTDAEYVAVPKILFIFNTLKSILPVKAYYKLYEMLGSLDVMDEYD